MKNRSLLWAMSTVAVVASGGFFLSRAVADGGPSQDALRYSGIISRDGQVPPNGPMNVTITIWDDETSVESSHSRCSTNDPDAAVVGGHFSIVLAAECAPLVASTPNLWVEVTADSQRLGRARISAAPYALEATRAATLAAPAAQVLVPSGSVTAYAGALVPAGWLLCDGLAVSRSMYPELFAAIGTTYGPGDNTTTFNLPDLRGRSIVGAGLGTMLTARTLGSSFGSERTSLTAAQLPPHQHSGTTGSGTAMLYRMVGGTGGTQHQWNHATGWFTASDVLDLNDDQYPLSAHQHAFTTDNGPGTSASITLAPPSVALQSIIKI